jgi:hypothetical protein
MQSKGLGMKERDRFFFLFSFFLSAFLLFAFLLSCTIIILLLLSRFYSFFPSHALWSDSQVPLSDYYSLIGLPVYFEKPLICNEINFGEVNCYLVLPGLPPTCQMEGGSRVDNVISGAQLTVAESPKPKNVGMAAHVFFFVLFYWRAGVFVFLLLLLLLFLLPFR